MLKSVINEWLISITGPHSADETPGTLCDEWNWPLTLMNNLTGQFVAGQFVVFVKNGQKVVDDHKLWFIAEKS